MKGLFSGGILSIVDQGISSLSNFLTVVILARALVPADVGVYTIIFASIMILGGVQSSFITGPLRIYYIKLDHVEIKNYLRNQFKLQFYCVIALAFLLFILTLLFSSIQINVALASSVALIFILMHEFVRVVYLSKLDFRSLLFVDVLCHLVRVLMLVAIYNTSWMNIVNTFYIIALGGVLSSVYFVTHQTVLRKSNNLKETINQNWRYGRWLFAESIAFSASTHFYIYVIAFVMTVEVVAGFNAVQNLLNVLNVLLMGGSGYLITVCRRSLIYEGYASWRHLLLFSGKLMLALTVIIVAALTIIGEWLLDFLYGEYYKEFSSLIPVLGGVYCLMALNIVLSVAFRTAELPQIGFIARIVSALFTIIFSVLLLEWWGLVGAAIGLIATQICWLVVYTYNIYKGVLSEERVMSLVKVSV